MTVDRIVQAIAGLVRVVTRSGMTYYGSALASFVVCRNE